jgi:hypothetical protein
MTELLVTYNGYAYLLAHTSGAHYTATCQRTGRVKTRLNPNLWHNRHNGLVTDADMIETFEAGVRQLQSMTTPKAPRAPLGVPRPQDAPPKVKGRKSQREWRGEAKS